MFIINVVIFSWQSFQRNLLVQSLSKLTWIFKMLSDHFADLGWTLNVFHLWIISLTLCYLRNQSNVRPLVFPGRHWAITALHIPSSSKKSSGNDSVWPTESLHKENNSGFSESEEIIVNRRHCWKSILNGRDLQAFRQQSIKNTLYYVAWAQELFSIHSSVNIVHCLFHI